MQLRVADRLLALRREQEALLTAVRNMAARDDCSKSRQLTDGVLVVDDT